MSDKRQHKREDIEFVLKYKAKDSSDSFKYAYYENISLGGVMMVDLKHSFERGTPIVIELSLPYTPNSSLANSILIDGLTAYCEETMPNKYNCGVQFIDLSEEKSEKLNIFLQYANGGTQTKEE